MNDQLLLIVGIVVFGLMLIGVILTILEFRRLPKRQKPEFEQVPVQAQPDPMKKDESAP